MITTKTKQALDTALSELKHDGYKVFVIMLGQKADEAGAEVICSETNDPKMLLAMLKATYERFIVPALEDPDVKDDASIENSSAAIDGHPRRVETWEVSSRMKSDGTWQKFVPGHEPTMLTSVSTECNNGDCQECPGIFSREDYPRQFIACVHECHLSQHHDSYIPRP